MSAAQFTSADNTANHHQATAADATLHGPWRLQPPSVRMPPAPRLQGAAGPGLGLAIPMPPPLLGIGSCFEGGGGLLPYSASAASASGDAARWAGGGHGQSSPAHYEPAMVPLGSPSEPSAAPFWETTPSETASTQTSPQVPASSEPAPADVADAL